MIGIHILVKGKSDYALFAALGAESFISKGGFEPSRIFVTASGLDIHNSPGYRALKSLGVTITDIHRTTSGKFPWIDRTFIRNPQITRLAQIDADVVLTEQVDLNAKFNELDCLVGAYPIRHAAINDLFPGRYKLCLEGFKYGNRADEIERVDEKERFKDFIRVLFDVDFDEFIKKTELWVIGSLIFVNREICNKPIWKSLVLGNWVNRCDESVILLARKMLGSDYQHLKQDWLRHRHWRAPSDNADIFDLESGPGMLHFNGSWKTKDLTCVERIKLFDRFKVLFPNITV